MSPSPIPNGLRIIPARNNEVKGSTRGRGIVRPFDLHPTGRVSSRNLPRGAVWGLEMGQNDIKLMEAAIALTEELNFSRAAQKLHITQPALTKRIAELEDRLGVQLFTRDHQMVEVNDSAGAFVEEARLSVLHGERAFQAARRAARGVDVVLNIGKSPYTDPFLVSTLLSVRLPLFPHLRVELTSQFSCELVHQVVGGSLDLAIATEPPESSLMTTVKIDESPFYIAISERDKLASRHSVSLEDLTGHCWSLFERRLYPPLSTRLCGALKVEECGRSESSTLQPPKKHSLWWPTVRAWLFSSRWGLYWWLEMG